MTSLQPLTIVGLGPGDPGQLSRAAWETLQAARIVLLRTRVHPTVPFLEPRLLEVGIPLESCDDLYDTSHSFEETYSRMTERVLQRAEQPGGMVFAVPGHPLIGERAVDLIRQHCAESGLPVKVVVSPGFLDAVISAVGLDIASGLAVLDAEEYRMPSPGLPAVYYQIYDTLVASDLKLALMDALPEETLVWHVQAAGTPDEEVRQIPLHRLDHLTFDHLTSVVVPAVPAAETRDFNHLVSLMSTLRSPEGCPWDREQTHQSLARYVLEEAYEVVDCIERDDLRHLPDELGDLLLQVVFHAQLAREAGLFDVGSVIEAISSKLIRRHPHVFGGAAAADAAEVIRNWDRIKAEERAAHGGAGDTESALSGVPIAIPILARADKVFRKAAAVGFDWPDAWGPLEKLTEEVAEVREAMSIGDPDAIACEIGDLFLAAINAARKLHLDPDQVTRSALRRFIRRFELMERRASVLFPECSSLNALSLEQWDQLWETAKVEESGRSGESAAPLTAPSAEEFS